VELFLRKKTLIFQNHSSEIPGQFLQKRYNCKEIDAESVREIPEVEQKLGQIREEIVLFY